MGIELDKHQVVRRFLAAQEDETRTYTITGSKDVLDRLEKVLLTMATLGSWGSSRTLQFGWDGDGSDKLHVEELEEETEKEIVNINALKMVEK